MTRFIKHAPWLRLSIAATILALALASSVYAGDFHGGAQLVCSDCHVMHGSHNGTTYNGGAGFGTLLKFGSTAGLCLSCHDGTDVTAPPVVATGTSATPTKTLKGPVAYASKFGNSAGFYQSDCTSATAAGNSPYAHNLGGGDVVAIQGTWSTAANGHAPGVGMACTDCHDPHSSGNNWRNLVSNPGGVSAPITQGSDVYLREAITTVGRSSATTATHYDTDAVAFNDPTKIVNWCVGCHTNITSNSNKHLQNVSVSALGAACGTHWTTGTGVGFDLAGDIGDTTAGIPRVRFAQAGASYADCSAVATSNKVFCLTCHKAHGSMYDSALLWPYATSSSADVTAGCNQCHNKGT